MQLARDTLLQDCDVAVKEQRPGCGLVQGLNFGQGVYIAWSCVVTTADNLMSSDQSSAQQCWTQHSQEQAYPAPGCSHNSTVVNAILL